VWQELSETIPDRVKGIVNNVKLLHKSAEDAKKDATLWASRSEGDEEREHEPAEEGITPGTTWRPQNADMRYSFHDAVHSLHSRKGITKDSPVLAGLLQALDGASFSDPEADPCTADTRPSRRATVETMTKPEIGMVRAAQLRLHKARVLAIEGDDEDGEGPNGDDDAGFGDGNDHHLFPPVPAPLNPSPTQAHTWVDIAPGSRFFQVGEMIGKHRTLNRMQKIALGLICEAMDRAEEAPDKTTDDDGGHRTGGPRQTQHLQYIGGSGGTGKSWLIDTLKEVFAAKGASKRIVITATSGTAAAGIGGNTIHSALGLAFKAQDGGDMESLPPANLERHRQRWRRRDALVVDEVSMLGLKTLYELDHKLRALRGFPDRPFGGMPVVVFTGDFLQFGPVLQKGLLSNFDYGGQVPRNLSERATQYRWQQLQAKKTWEMFTSVVILEEQKRAEGDEELIGLLDRIRTGQQTAADLDELNSRYDSDKKLDFTGGRRAIIPLNRHRWDLTLCAALAFGEEHDRKVSLFLCDHRWKTRVPTEEEMEAALLLGDDAQLPIPGILPYVEGMPVIVNQNKYLGLKVVNGAEFTAAGVVANEEVEERVINERLSIFLGPPSGILLRSQDTEGLAFPHIPPGTLMLGTETVQLHKEKHGKHICPRLAAKPDFRMGLTRTGLPCVPGFALTDYKAQSRTLEKVLLGLYGRKETKGGQGTDKCDVLSLYVQLSRCKRLEDIRLIQPIKKEHFEQARMHPELVEGLNRLKELARQTVERFEARHGSIASVTGEVA
jgi:hypothetical protein